MTASITLQHVTKRFAVRAGADSADGSALTAIDDISLDVPAGDFLTLVGPSGSGKTTLLDLLAGLSTPTSGAVLVDGVPITGPGQDRGVVFQQYALFPWRTALANVAFPLESVPVSGTRLARKDRLGRAREFLRLVGLEGFEDRYPHELSGGMKQRVAIARSLAYAPGILLMDEPFGALDAQTRDQLQDELLRIWRATGTTIVFITHDIDEAVYLGQRVAVLSARPGRLRTIVDTNIPWRQDGSDVRSDPQFVRSRHEIWSLLHGADDTAAHEDGSVAPTGAESDSTIDATRRAA